MASSAASPLVIVPYRDNGDGVRAAQLQGFLSHLRGLKPHLRVLVVEQHQQPNEKVKFNRGAVLNCGAAWARAHYQGTTHFIFHDVDLLPSEDLFRHYWRVPPKNTWWHFGACWKRYTAPPYFGGITAVRPGAFWAVHGFSNQFWGWGGEDDDLRRRVQAAGHGIVRFPELDGHVVDVEAMTLQEKLTHLRAHPDEKCLDKWEAAAASQRVGSAADGATTVRHRVVDFHNHLLPDDHWTVVLRVEVERDQEDGGAEEG